MKLTSRIRITKEFEGTSKFVFWNTIQPGDVLFGSLNVRQLFRSRNGLESTVITLKNERTGEKFSDSMTMIAKRLLQLKYEEIEETKEASSKSQLELAGH